MNQDLAYRGSGAISIWPNGELPGSSSWSKCLEHQHVHAPCTPSPSLPAEDAPLPPRWNKTGITGSLSLHEYRKHLSQSAECIDDPVDRSTKTLKRKTANSNLNRPPALSSIPTYATSLPSASTPPPLSPSYSHSIVSQCSEQELETPVASVAPSPRGSRVHLVSENATRPRPNRKRLNTFREKLQENAQARGHPQQPLSRPHKSNSMLANTQAVATISHGGASFEILNPRKSLDLARIVSFIEDVDTCSVPADHIRDSKVSSNHFSLDQASISQFTDASLPSHYSTQSLYTSLPAAHSTPKKQATDIPSSSPGVYDRVRSLSDYSLHEHDYWTSDRQCEEENNDLLYHGHTGDEKTQRMASISERPDEKEELSDPESPRPPSSCSPTFYSEESDIGEPGSPVYANGEWSQVNGRDRGIFMEQPSPSTCDPPSPYETYYANTMAPYAMNYDPYDPIWDPHVQSVLAAANAETMGLRGHPARTLDDFQRRFQSSTSLSDDGPRRKSEDRKQSFTQRKRFRKLFSWRSGN
ncbi:hypothetical protein N7492_009062 [Penicillium capsulatum]|uniref:Uncharacterized protein n=1 Tax=Penicillium capsulatum TaxID=69766 RepID=A0A9W9HWG8_9EURO|nr:hypothetical protein N7492_009062 [Penicillium capsulatum]KAJ6106461.1 hypothetical protein N7512_009978 [Penicillium capsulatum]